MMNKHKAHILIFPYPAQGHMVPLLNFAHQLSIRGLDITILITPKNLPLLTPILTRNPSIQTLVLPFPVHPSIPAGVENVRELPVSGFRAMMYTLTRLSEPIKEWFRAHPSPPTAIVFDMFLGWTNRLASELGVPGYVFSSSGGLALSVIYSLWRDLPRKENPDSDNELIRFLKVPNSPAYPWRQLSTVYRDYIANENNPVHETIKASFLGDLTSFGLVINTVTKLEKKYLDHFKGTLGHNRVWAVGPVLPPEDHQSQSVPAQKGASGSSNSSIPANEVLEWLDSCKDQNSVVYVCFGTQFVLSPDQMEALTLALDISRVRFILAIKGPTKGNEGDENPAVIPSGFKESVSGRGLVIKGLAPQVLILRHPCVGAFLTHCGWNSVLEGITAGVPMLAWPMGADQFSNATLIVDELKVGCRVCEDNENVPNYDRLAGILARAIGDEFQEERKRALGFHKAALDAIQEGGSSYKNLDHLALHFSEMSSNSIHHHHIDDELTVN